MAKDVRRKILETLADPTVNEELFEDALRHATLIDRWRAGLNNRINKLLDSRILPAMLNEIEREARKVADGKKQATRLKRLLRMEVILRASIGKRFAPLRELLFNELVSTATLERDSQLGFLAKSLDVVSKPLEALGVKFNVPSPEIMRELVRRQPFQGGTLGQWMSGLSRRLATEARQQVSIGVSRGDPIEDIVRNLRERFPKEIRRNLRTITRTAVTHVTSAARETVYENNDDVVKGVRYVATLDSRTTMICASLDGRVFDIGDGPRPPQHFNCRSTTVPVLKSWQELGINAKDISPTARASIDGEVAAGTTYSQWLKRQPARVQNEALGKTRARLFRQGKLEINGLVDNQNRPLTLEEIRKKEGLSMDDIATK